MEQLEFKKGDECWIAMGNKDLSRGKVLEVLELSEHGYTWPHYLIEVSTHIDPVLEVRDGLTMSDAKDKPLGFWRKNKA